ncbi:hypothetical protein P0D88_08430 [Paraburkholderia sp. RL18-103-BIB-C]|uniref:ABC transporter permease subunit n=1 Tax=Paraburkholderia sp. RL18-103-BIB-C TaxID=3031637 RepID=UPI0038BC66C3
MTVDAALYSGNAGGSAASIPLPTVVEFNGRALGASYAFSDLTVKASYVQYKVAGSFNSHGIYSLVALGLTLVYGILAVPNFAHGAFYMVGAFVSFYLLTAPLPKGRGFPLHRRQP